MSDGFLDQYIGWLNYGRSSLLPSFSEKILEKINQKVKENDLPGVRDLAKQICSLCDQKQSAEALVTCAKVMYKIGDTAKAMDFLYEARKRYRGDRHRVAVVQWISGLILWQIQNRDGEAMKAWVTAIKDFEWLQVYSRNDPEKVIWYRKRLAEMRRDLDKAIEENGIPFLLTGSR